MSLHDWQLVYGCLRDDIVSYITGDPFIRPAPKEFILHSVNIRLDSRWIALIADNYREFVPNIQMDTVFPYVQFVRVTTKSGAVEFTSDNAPESCNNEPKTMPINVPDECKDKVPEMRRCRVLLKKLINRNGAQRISMSTPLVRHASNIVIPIENDVSVISSEPSQTQTIHDQTESGGRRNSRKRLFEEITETPARQVTPMRQKTRSTRGKRKIRISPSQHLQSARKARRKQLDKSTKTARATKPKRTAKQTKQMVKTIVTETNVTLELTSDIQNIEAQPDLVTESSALCLETMAMNDLLATFDCCSAHLTKLFNDYLKQTDENVQKAGDYNPMDVMAMISHDQFGAMADVLYEHFTPIGDINVSISLVKKNIWYLYEIDIKAVRFARTVWITFLGAIAARMDLGRIHGQTEAHSTGGHCLYR